jgi:hypothetical protein
MRSYFLEKNFRKNLCIAGLLNDFFVKYWRKRTSRLVYFIRIIQFGLAKDYFVIPT